MAEQAQETSKDQTEELLADKQEPTEVAAGQAEREAVQAKDRSHFFAVANSLLHALHWQSPQLTLPDTLTHREVDALTLIYEARTATETEYGSANISGLERMRYLNEGLLVLQGTLAMARSDSFPQSRAHIEEIRRLIARLKQEIAQAILDDERRKREEEQKKEQEKKRNEDDAAAKKVAEAQTKKG